MLKDFTSSRVTGFPIGELSRKTGVHIETIRYYERIGFVPPPPRGADGRRTFGAEDVKRLCFIKRSRDMGFSQDEVRALLRLADGGEKSCSEVSVIAQAHLKDIRAKISDLRKLEKVLSETVSKCMDGDAPVCPVLEALYH
jgi:MerR family transcriptional regulator, mercuric resistance operon regulatory protein